MYAQHKLVRPAQENNAEKPAPVDLLCGSSEARVALETRIRPRELTDSWASQLADWAEIREQFLRY